MRSLRSTERFFQNKQDKIEKLLEEDDDDSNFKLDEMLQAEAEMQVDEDGEGDSDDESDDSSDGQSSSAPDEDDEDEDDDGVSSLDRHSDSYIRDYVVRTLWLEGAAIDAKAEQVEKLLEIYHSGLLEHGKSHYYQDPDEQYRLAKRAFKPTTAALGDNSLHPWKSRSSQEVFTEMVEIAVEGETFRLSLHHLYLIAESLRWDNIGDVLLEEYAEKKVTARECFPWPKMLIECPVEKNKKGVVYGKVAMGKVLIGMSTIYPKRHTKYLNEHKLNSRCRRMVESIPIDSWDHMKLISGGDDYPPACLYLFEHSMIMLGRSWISGLNIRPIDCARMSGVLCRLQVDIIYEKTVEWLQKDPKNKVPAGGQAHIWNEIIGDSLRTTQEIRSSTIYAAIFGHSWQYLDKKRTFIWRPEHFASGELPARFKDEKAMARLKDKVPVNPKGQTTASDTAANLPRLTEQAEFKKYEAAHADGLKARGQVTTVRGRGRAKRLA